MTRGELEVCWSYDRTLYLGAIPVKIHQVCSAWSSAETVVVQSATNPKGRQWRCSFEELTAVPVKEMEKCS